MESAKSELTQTTATTTTTSRITMRQEKPILREMPMPKLVPVSSVSRPAPMEPQQQSVLKKTVGGQNLIKILPKTIPLKTIHGPNGNLIVHGPHNKILSLQIKSAIAASAGLPASLSLLPITIPKEAKAAMAKLPGVTLIHKTSALSPAVTTAISSANSPTLPTFVSSKNLEIKPITVTNSPKALTPAQAATVPITMSQITPTNLISKLFAAKSDPKDVDSVIIEKKNAPKPQPMKIVPITNDLAKAKLNPTATAVPAGNKMINLQISNGILSDPNGPIRIISANNNANREKDKIIEKAQSSSKEKEKVLPISEREKTPEGAIEATASSPPNSFGRIKNTDSIIQARKYRIKQQSLLKNKTVEQLQRSPRTKGRSKSLTLSKIELNSKKRRLSIASDSDIKKTGRKKSASITPSILKTPPEMQVNKLLCPEKMSASSDSLVSSSPIEDTVVSVSCGLVNYPSSEIIEMNSSDDESKPYEVMRTSETEIYNYLEWKNGVGSLKESKLQFQFNEFGLIETVEDDINRLSVEVSYDKPIFEREYKSQKTLDYSDPYFCKGCNCKGAAVDFLAPEFCSHECIRRYNRRVSSGLIAKPTKKYTNRKKILSTTPEEVKQEPILPKSFKVFTWETYLSKCKGEPTPIDLFLNPFPCSPNMFQIGMKLEAIDPEHSSMFCVCTIAEKRGYRIKLHFDGYSKFYDFWLNADSMDIFPPGWCAKTNRFLHPPKGISPMSFNWPMYLAKTKALPAPRNLFTHLNSSSRTNPFKAGMKIEADDLRNTGKVCVASIADLLDNRILIHFDGWDDSYNYWIDINSPYIHPVNWHSRNGFSIVPPPEWQDRFSWQAYLAQTKSEPATDELFTTRDAIEFKPGMKLEVVDKRNPALIRPGSVIMTDDYEVKVLFDGWNMEYAFWVEDDSPDIHPIGWCEITDHELERPPEYGSLPTRYDCEFPGCRGVGNAKHTELDMHTNIMSCPYEPNNWTKEIDKTGRLDDIKKYDNISALNIKNTAAKNKRKAMGLQQPSLLAKYPKQEQLEEELQQPQILLPTKIEKPDNSLDSRINVARHLLCDYGPRLQQVYSLWKRNSECLAVNLPENQGHGKNPLEWSVAEVADYIGQLPRCQTAGQEFIQHEIDGAAFLSMRQNDLTEHLKIKLGPAIKIYNQIVQLREDVVTRFLSNFSST